MGGRGGGSRLGRPYRGYRDAGAEGGLGRKRMREAPMSRDCIKSRVIADGYL